MMGHRGIKTILEDKLKVGWRETDCGDDVYYVQGIEEAAHEISNLIAELINASVKR
jgi:hypothetical protein